MDGGREETVIERGMGWGRGGFSMLIEDGREPGGEVRGRAGEGGLGAVQQTGNHSWGLLEWRQAWEAGPRGRIKDVL